MITLAFGRLTGFVIGSFLFTAAGPFMAIAQQRPGRRCPPPRVVAGAEVPECYAERHRVENDHQTREQRQLRESHGPEPPPREAEQTEDRDLQRRVDAKGEERGAPHGQ